MFPFIARNALPILLFILLSPSTRGEEEKWKVFENCTLMENASNDGDSFHVKYNAREYIFRLYWVDAPETDARYPDRNADQAVDMNISMDEVVKLGKDAGKFAAEQLKEPFTVYTTYQDARGASDLKRYYAMVETKQGFLSQILLENGYARLKGYQPDPPGPLSRRTYYMRLSGIAKKKPKPGAAATNNSASPTPIGSPVGQTYTAKKSILIFKEKPPHAPAGTIKAGTKVSVISEAEAGRVKVTFTFPNGRSYTGLCFKTDVLYRN